MILAVHGVLEELGLSLSSEEGEEEAAGQEYVLGWCVPCTLFGGYLGGSWRIRCVVLLCISMSPTHFFRSLY
jgi:hypothetical protein